MKDLADTKNQLEVWFRDGMLIHPLDDQQAGSMDLFHALSSLCGVKQVEASKHADKLAHRIGPAENYIFVLVDGFGMNQRNFFAPSGFFVRFFEQELRAIFPSTTATVLTSLATLQWPARHSIVGWFTHLPELGFTSIPLLFQRRSDEAPLEHLGIQPDQVFPLPSFIDRFDRYCCSFVYNEYVDSSFSRWSRAETGAIGFASIDDAFKKLASYFDQSSKSSYAYLYIAEIDHLNHRYGWNDQRVREAVHSLDRRLLDLKKNLNGKTRLIVTSDHGHINVPRQNQIVLEESSPLLETLQTPPSGDLRMPLFHVRRGRKREFLKAFETSLSASFTLIDNRAAEQLRLFGPGPLSPLTKSRLGDYIGISISPCALLYNPPEKEPINFIGFHAGLSADEMRIPLFIA